MHKAFTVCDDRGFSGADRCNIIRDLTEDHILARIGGIEDGEELYKQTEIVMLDDTSSGGLMSRRDFLGCGITAAATLTFLNGCGNPGEIILGKTKPASDSSDKTIKLWNLSERAVTNKLEGRKQAAQCLYISPASIALRAARTAL